MGTEFKSFLKGLLNKTPSERLGWPDLLHHAFIKENEQERADRKKRQERYNDWVVELLGVSEDDAKGTPELFPNRISSDSSKSTKTEVNHLSQPT